jgi:hypothetical protein
MNWKTGDGKVFADLRKHKRSGRLPSGKLPGFTSECKSLIDRFNQEQ